MVETYDRLTRWLFPFPVPGGVYMPGTKETGNNALFTRRLRNMTKVVYEPAHLWGDNWSWYGPGFRESMAWHEAERRGEKPARTILPGQLFHFLRGGQPCSSGRNILTYASREAALTALRAAEQAAEQVAQGAEMRRDVRLRIELAAIDRAARQLERGPASGSRDRRRQLAAQIQKTTQAIQQLFSRKDDS
jgi:hypothetical protein